VVGYGLDYQDHYRNLPFLGVLEPGDLQRCPTDALQTLTESGNG
jgi:hypothetical protein